jgi:hypothetical protein
VSLGADSTMRDRCQKSIVIRRPDAGPRWTRAGATAPRWW